MTATSTRYSIPLLILHWTTAVLVLLAYFTSEGGAKVRHDPQTLHVIWGLSVLLLTLPRLLVRWIVGVPPAVEPTTKRMGHWARMGHAIMYCLLLAVPVLGWITLSRLGWNIEFLGLRLPWLVPSIPGDPGVIATLHQVGGNLLLILAGLHACVALWHQFWLRDRLLQRMLPFR